MLLEFNHYINSEDKKPLSATFEIYKPFYAL